MAKVTKTNTGARVVTYQPNRQQEFVAQPKVLKGQLRGSAQVQYSIVNGKLKDLKWRKSAVDNMNIKKDLSKAEKLKLRAQQKLISESLVSKTTLSKHFI